jgi:methionyl aminopeptidase
MRESAQLVSKTLGMLAKEIKPGVTTLYLDKLAHDYIKDHGGYPGFLGMYGFPNSLCISPTKKLYTVFRMKNRLKKATFYL